MCYYFQTTDRLPHKQAHILSKTWLDYRTSKTWLSLNMHVRD